MKTEDSQSEAIPTLYTIGHSTRSIEELISLLQKNKVETLADVRSFPGSRKWPQFNSENLALSIPEAGMVYLPMKGLGGRRKAHKDSPNTVWRNISFRSYADFMETDEFKENAAILDKYARSHRTCLMCSEAVWWRCHRSMISDYFKNKGWLVLHILSPTKVQEHPYTSAARIVGGQLTYHDETDMFYSK